MIIDIIERSSWQGNCHGVRLWTLNVHLVISCFVTFSCFLQNSNITKGNTQKHPTDIMQFISPLTQCTLSLCLRAVHVDIMIMCSGIHYYQILTMCKPAGMIQNVNRSIIDNNTDQYQTRLFLSTSALQLHKSNQSCIKHGNMQVHMYTFIDHVSFIICACV